MDAAQPSLVVVDGDERELTRTAAELRRRYGSDYRIVAESFCGGRAGSPPSDGGHGRGGCRRPGGPVAS